MKFSKGQILLAINLQAISKDFSNYHCKDGYYAETGKYKPFSKHTIYAMERKEYITITRVGYTGDIFYLKHGVNFDKMPTFTWADYEYAK